MEISYVLMMCISDMFAHIMLVWAAGSSESELWNCCSQMLCLSLANSVKAL